MELTRSRIVTNAEAYQDVQPLSAVETQHLDILPQMLRDGEYGWRDLEWVVQWYYRRFLGAYPDKERRAAENAFGENTYEAVADVLTTVTETATDAEKIRSLTQLDGVAVPVASAYLFFMSPDEYLAVDNRQWRVLATVGQLDGQYPDPPSSEAYIEYLDVCRELAERLDVELVTLYRALWQLGSDSFAEASNDVH